jgi:hypothetical protein
MSNYKPPIKLSELAELCEAASRVFVEGSRKNGWMPELDIKVELDRLLKAYTAVKWKVDWLQEDITVEVIE